jgi:hypothetical protein
MKMECVNTQAQYDARLKADLERGEIALIQFHPNLSWYIAIGNNHGWGRSDKSEKDAIRSMNANGFRGKKASQYAVYRCTSQTTVNEMGGFTRPMGDPVPVKIRQVGY